MELCSAVCVGGGGSPGLQKMWEEPRIYICSAYYMAIGPRAPKEVGSQML